jgi:hypothetical protein
MIANSADVASEVTAANNALAPATLFRHMKLDGSFPFDAM